MTFKIAIKGKDIHSTDPRDFSLNLDYPLFKIERTEKKTVEANQWGQYEVIEQTPGWVWGYNYSDMNGGSYYFTDFTFNREDQQWNRFFEFPVPICYYVIVDEVLTNDV